MCRGRVAFLLFGISRRCSVEGNTSNDRICGKSAGGRGARVAGRWLRGWIALVTRSRVLARTLALLFLPVVMVTTSVEVASAETGVVALAKFSDERKTSGVKFSCSVAGWWDEPAGPGGGNPAVQMGGGKCSTGFNVSSLLVRIKPDGTACTFGWSSWVQMDGGGTLRPTHVPTGSFSRASCVVTHLEWEAVGKPHTNPWHEAAFSGRTTFELGRPPAAGNPNYQNGQCAIFDMQGVPTIGFQGSRTRNNGQGSDGSWFVKPQMVWKGTRTSSNRFYARMFGYSKDYPNLLQSFETSMAYPSSTGVAFGELSFSQVDSWSHKYDDPTFWRWVGVSFYYRPSTSAGQWYPANDAYTNAFPQDNPAGDWGTTVPSKCYFHFGEKLAEIPTSTEDDPAGPMGVSQQPYTPPADPGDQTPDASESGCQGFSLTDPGSWASAGICAVARGLAALVGVMEAVLDAILAVAGAILQGLQALFVPSSGFFEAETADVKDAWAQTPPVVIGSELGSIPGKFVQPASAASCKGPDIPVKVPYFELDKKLYPFSTCDPDAATVASIAKVCMQIALALGGLLVGARILASAFGVDASLRGGAGA